MRDHIGFQNYHGLDYHSSESVASATFSESPTIPPRRIKIRDPFIILCRQQASNPGHYLSLTRPHPRPRRISDPSEYLTKMSNSLSRRPSLSHHSVAHESDQGCHNPCHPQSVPKPALTQVPSRQWARCWLLIAHWLKFHQGRWPSPWRGRTAGCSSSAAPWRRRPTESC